MQDNNEYKAHDNKHVLNILSNMSTEDNVEEKPLNSPKKKKRDTDTPVAAVKSQKKTHYSDILKEYHRASEELPDGKVGRGGQIVSGIVHSVMVSSFTRTLNKVNENMFMYNVSIWIKDKQCIDIAHKASKYEMEEIRILKEHNMANGTDYKVNNYNRSPISVEYGQMFSFSYATASELDFQIGCVVSVSNLSFSINVVIDKRKDQSKKSNYESGGPILNFNGTPTFHGVPSYKELRDMVQYSHPPKSFDDLKRERRPISMEYLVPSPRCLYKTKSY